MYYLIDKTTNQVVGSLTSTDNYDTSNYIVVESDISAPLSNLVYDESSNSISEISSDDELAMVKDAKLEELKSQIQSEFATIGDVLADIVKAIKLVMKIITTTDDSTKADLVQYISGIVDKLEQIYPDDYCKQCVTNYTEDLLTQLPRYYTAKTKVTSATTKDDVLAVTIEDS